MFHVCIKIINPFLHIIIEYLKIKLEYRVAYQIILFLIGTFVYGIPVAREDSLAESSIKDIIINYGWTIELKPIFHSNKKIRELGRFEFQVELRKFTRVLECKGLHYIYNDKTVMI